MPGAQQLVRDAYLKGILDISTFLQSQRTLSDATVDYIDALDDTWQAAADLANLLQLEQFPELAEESRSDTLAWAWQKTLAIPGSIRYNFRILLTAARGLRKQIRRACHALQEMSGLT